MFTAVKLDSKQAVKQAQTLLNLINPNSPITVDGVVGPKTSSAYKELPVQGRTLVDSMIIARNPAVLEELTNPASKKTKNSSSGKWIPRDEVLVVIKQVVAQFGGFPPNCCDAVEYLAWLLDLEPRSQVSNGVREYDANSLSPNGVYTGLYQLGPDAYTDVVQKKNLLKDLPAFAIAARDPRYAAYLALQYGKCLIMYMRTGFPVQRVAPYKGTITKEILYGAHNQGAYGLLSGAKNALTDGKQSKVATAVIQEAVRTLYA